MVTKMIDDLISRRAAIDAPEEFIKDCNPDHFTGHQKFIEFMDNAEIGSFGNWQFANGFNMGLTAAEVAIKNLPSAQQWIPCSEGLPKKDGRYQVTRYDYVTKTESIDILWYEKNLWWNRRFTGDYAVTAWMPLPEPWKGEEDENS